MRGIRAVAGMASAMLAGAIAACGAAAPAPDSPPRQPPPAERPTGTPVDQTVAGMRALAGTFGDAATEDGQNVVYSPASLAYAFAMLRAGADGETASQLDEVFGFPGDDVHAVMSDLSEDVVTTGDAPPKAGPDDTREPGEPPADPIVAIANGLFVQQGTALGEDFLRTLARHYDSEAEQVDFRSGRAKETIDDWVAEQTAGRIKELFGELDPDTVAVLANAVYLKAQWLHPFSEDLTRKDDFRSADGSTVQAPMMRTREPKELSYVDGDGWQAAELPYTGGELAMWVLVPEDQDADAPRMTAETLDTLNDSEPALVDLTMPRWDFSTDVELLPVLSRMGLTNLSKLSGIAPGFFVTDAIHRANITVDEMGTEAAAVTGIAGATSVGPEPEVIIRADQPFSFAIVHSPTGAPLFVGSVNDPTRGAE